MKIILSRKGFDSSTGKVPSPVFPDGTMISLPIPDRSSTIAYKDIAGNACASVGELGQDLAGRPPTHRVEIELYDRSNPVDNVIERDVDL